MTYVLFVLQLPVAMLPQPCPSPTAPGLPVVLAPLWVNRVPQTAPGAGQRLLCAWSQALGAQPSQGSVQVSRCWCVAHNNCEAVRVHAASQVLAP